MHNLNAEGVVSNSDMADDTAPDERPGLKLFLAAALDEAAACYPGALCVHKCPGLDRERRAAEARAVHALENDLKGFTDRYESLNGNYLGADEAKELFDEYACSYETRKMLVHAVHYPSGALVKAIWDRRLAEPRAAADEFVMFTAGGPGSGKTTAIEVVPETNRLRASAFIVHDTMFAELERSERKIQDVLQHGRRAVVVYVYRPVEKAMVGVIERARQTGRIVTLRDVAEKHYECQETILALFEKYGPGSGVEFIVLDNSGEVGEALRIPLERLRGDLYREREATLRCATEALDEEFVERAGTPDEMNVNLFIAIRDTGVDS